MSRLNPDELDLSHLHDSERIRIRNGDLSRDEVSKLMQGENPWPRLSPQDTSSMDSSQRVQILQDPEGDFILLIDSEPIDAALIGHHDDGRSKPVFLVLVHSVVGTDRVIPYSFEELATAGIYHVQLPYVADWFEPMRQLWVMASPDGEVTLSFRFNILSRWVEPYTFERYFECLSEQYKNSVESSEFTDEDDSGFSLSFPVDKYLPLQTEIERCEELLIALHQNAIQELQASRAESLIVSFDFPEEVRVACEQYLVYFVQFLEDVGVKATANITHEADHVLFAVTPDDKETALDKIYAALGEYLNLARTPIDEASIVSIAEQRLAATVDHLKAQLRLRNAELQLAQATVQTQQVAIQVLKGDVLLDSVRDITPQKSDDKESFLGGSVALTPYNYKGVELNFPEIFRKVRRFFSKRPSDR